MAENEVEDLSYLDDMLTELDEITSRSGGNDINLAFLKDCEFKARIVLDSRKKLSHDFYFYSEMIKMVGDDGTMKDKKVRVKAKNYKEDTLKPLVDELNNWKLKKRLQVGIFCEITEISSGASDYFKLGISLLVCSNMNMLKALKEAIKNMAQQRQVLADTLNPEKEGFCFVIKNVKGKGGTCTVNVDQFGKKHTFNPEDIAKFEDVSKVYNIEYGSENDSYIQLLESKYREMIAAGESYVEPKGDLEGGSTDAATGTQEYYEPKAGDKPASNAAPASSTDASEVLGASGFAELDKALDESEKK